MPSATPFDITLRADPHFPVKIAPRIWVDQQIPRVLREIIVPLFQRYAWLVPAWCFRVEVFWSESQTDAAADSRCLYDYGTAAITLYPNFLSRADLQEISITHELLHIQLEPMANTVKDLRDFLAERHPECKSLFHELIRHAEERTISSLTNALLSNEVDHA